MKIRVLQLVIERAIVIIVPLVTPLLFGAVLFLAPIFNLTVGISVADDVAQVMVIPISPSAVFLRVESNYWLSPYVDSVSGQDPDPAHRRHDQELGP
jgi:hypothetical protein